MEYSEVPLVVYVDSRSADDSVTLARSLGVQTIELDPGTPFSAARARNEGFGRLRLTKPNLACVQFVDGDCELCPGWMATAAEFPRDHEDAAVVSGRLREKYPENSIYNTLEFHQITSTTRPIRRARSSKAQASRRDSSRRVFSTELSVEYAIGWCQDHGGHFGGTLRRSKTVWEIQPCAGRRRQNGWVGRWP